MENPDQAPEAVAEEPVVDAATSEEAAAEPVTEKAAAEAPAEEAVVEEAPVAATVEAVAEEPTEEHVVDGLIDGDTLVPMVHPDGGTSDAYQTNDKHQLLVPATDVAVMMAHGFVPAGAE